MAHAQDPFVREHLDDPYPFYARLRAHPEDLIEVPERGVLLAARHDVARAVLRDHTTYRSGLGVQWIPVAEAGLRATFIENDPPEHTRVRRAVQQWCTPRAIDEIAAVVDTIVEELVDDLVAAGGGDVMTTLARRVPLRVMSEWLGLALPDAATGWADASFRLGAPDPPASAEEQFAGFLAWALGDGFATVRPGGLAEAILAGGDEQRLHDDEPFVALASIVIAGLDTTVHLIGNGIAALAAHPDQLAALVDDPAGLSGGAVEEALRYDAPVRFFLRRTDDGRTVVVLYGSANRDERVFAEPDRFVIDRDASAHLAFGAGIHLCLGAPLARLEGTAVFRTLAERVATIDMLPGARRTRLGRDPRLRHAARPTRRRGEVRRRLAVPGRVAPVSSRSGQTSPVLQPAGSTERRLHRGSSGFPGVCVGSGPVLFERLPIDRSGVVLVVVLVGEGSVGSPDGSDDGAGPGEEPEHVPVTVADRTCDSRRSREPRAGCEPSIRSPSRDVAADGRNAGPPRTRATRRIHRWRRSRHDDTRT